MFRRTLVQDCLKSRKQLSRNQCKRLLLHSTPNLPKVCASFVMSNVFLSVCPEICNMLTISWSFLVLQLFKIQFYDQQETRWLAIILCFMLSLIFCRLSLHICRVVSDVFEHQEDDPVAPPERTVAVDQTTLLSNDAEAFALGPIDVTNLGIFLKLLFVYFLCKWNCNIKPCCIVYSDRCVYIFWHKHEYTLLQMGNQILLCDQI